MSRRMGRGGRPRHPDHRGGPRPHDPTRVARPSAQAPTGPGSVAGAPLPETRPDVLRANADPAQRNPPPEATIEPRTPPAPDPYVPVVRPAGDGIAAAQDAAVPSIAGADVQGSAAEVPLAGPTPGAQVGLIPVERHSGCTTAQLRRFIKSRAYVPMHEIRRRFLITTEDDDVAGIELVNGRIFVGLPEREGQMLGELLRGGEIGFELQLDPVAPVVVGVYPMRPVTRG